MPTSPGHISEESHSRKDSYRHPSVHSSAIYNSQDAEDPRRPFTDNGQQRPGACVPVCVCVCGGPFTQAMKRTQSHRQQYESAWTLY